VKHNIPLPSARLVEDNSGMLIQPSLAKLPTENMQPCRLTAPEWKA